MNQDIRLPDVRLPVESVGELVATITLTGMRAWRWRVWLVTVCIRLAAWIAPANVKIVIE